MSERASIIIKVTDDIAPSILGEQDDAIITKMEEATTCTDNGTRFRINGSIHAVCTAVKSITKTFGDGVFWVSDLISD